jgi:hypothetical protein
MIGADMPRPLSGNEQAVIARLLSVSFHGRVELRAELPFTTVEGRCGCGCATVNPCGGSRRRAGPGAVQCPSVG